MWRLFLDLKFFKLVNIQYFFVLCLLELTLKMHLLVWFMILVLSFCKSISNSNPDIAEMDKVAEEMAADEEELNKLSDEVKKSPKVYEDELNTVSNIDKMAGAGKPIDKFGEVLKEASADLAAIREGWKARDKIKIAAGKSK